MKEAKLELIIRGMRFLKLKIYPMDALEETAEFLRLCSDHFQGAQGVRVKAAFADVFVGLLDPIAAVSLGFGRFFGWAWDVVTRGRIGADGPFFCKFRWLRRK